MSRYMFHPWYTGLMMDHFFFKYEIYWGMNSNKLSLSYMLIKNVDFSELPSEFDRK
jgi:hypothetical protein